MRSAGAGAGVSRGGEGGQGPVELPKGGVEPRAEVIVRTAQRRAEEEGRSRRFRRWLGGSEVDRWTA